jgi:hypothetical protein
MKEGFRRNATPFGVAYVAMRAFNFTIEMGKRVNSDPDTRSALAGIAEMIGGMALQAFSGLGGPWTRSDNISDFAVTLNGEPVPVDPHFKQPAQAPKRGPGRPKAKKETKA